MPRRFLPHRHCVWPDHHRHHQSHPVDLLAMQHRARDTGVAVLLARATPSPRDASQGKPRPRLTAAPAPAACALSIPTRRVADTVPPDLAGPRRSPMGLRALTSAAVPWSRCDACVSPQSASAHCVGSTGSSASQSHGSTPDMGSADATHVRGFVDMPGASGAIRAVLPGGEPSPSDRTVFGSSQAPASTVQIPFHPRQSQPDWR